MAKIIGLIQVKGGAGRSTISTNLATLLSKKGKTAIIDCDLPQGTAMSWYAMRAAEDLTGNLSLITAKDHKELAKQYDAISQSFDYIVLDAPPRIEELTRMMLMLSDLVIIPIGASMADIWATNDLLELIEEAKKKRPQLNYRILWNKYRAYTKAAQELSEAVKTELNAPEFKTKLGLRVAYTEAMANGKGVIESKDKAAKKEMESLGRELMKIIKD